MGDGAWGVRTFGEMDAKYAVVMARQETFRRGHLLVDISKAVGGRRLVDVCAWEVKEGDGEEGWEERAVNESHVECTLSYLNRLLSCCCGVKDMSVKCEFFDKAVVVRERLRMMDVDESRCEMVKADYIIGAVRCDG